MKTLVNGTVKVLAIIGMIVCMMGCKQEEKNVSTDDIVENKNSEPEVVEEENLFYDFSDFSFNNMYSMNEWIEIDTYFLSGGKGFLNIQGSYNVLNYANGFIEVRSFESGQPFIEDRSEGELKDLLSYEVVSDNLISLQTDGESVLEIEIHMWEGIPIISLSLVDGYGLDYLESTFIPTNFIDWIRGPFNDSEIVGYCINPDYLDPRVERYSTFAASVMKAAYSDFDASVLLESIHPIALERVLELFFELDGEYEEEVTSSMLFEVWISYNEEQYANKKTCSMGNIMFVNEEASAVERLIDFLEEMNFDVDSWEDYVDSCAVIEITTSFDDSSSYEIFEFWIVEEEGKLYYLNPWFY